MNSKISKRDWETISAFLDGQLSPRKQASFETRLLSDPKLQDATEQIRQTRHLLRNTPQIRAPRNFTLTHEMVGQPIRLPQFAPVFGWASALASFLLILVIVGDIFTPGGFATSVYRLPSPDESATSQVQVVKGDTVITPKAAEVSAADNGGTKMEQSEADAEPPESQAMDVAAEVATAPVMESTPVDEPVSESEDVASFTAGEQVPPEKPEVRALTAPKEGEAVFETPIGGIEGRAEVDAEDTGMDQAENLSDSEVVSDTAQTETEEESPTEEVVAAEELSQTEAENTTQPVSDEMVAAPAAASQKEQVEVPTDEDGEMALVPEAPTEQAELLTKEVSEPIVLIESTPSSSWMIGELLIAKVPVPDNVKDHLIGVEMILLLFAGGTGLAWIYLRRRGG